MADELERAYDDFRFQTLWEVWGETPIWEVFGDTGNFFPPTDFHTRVTLAERLLLELWQEGWVRFVRLSDPNERGEQGDELGGSEIESLIRSGVWHASPPTGDALHVVLVPTEKTRSWRRQRLGSATETYRGDE